MPSIDNKEKSNLFDNKDKIKTEIFSVLDNKAISRTESAFHRPKRLSNLITLSLSDPISQNTNNYKLNSSNNLSTIFTKKKNNQYI